MINDKNQKQQAGNDSTNLQAQSIVVHQGISYTDAKEIALDVYKANFLQLSQDAAQLASSRAEELTDKFLEKLEAENKAAIDSMKEPAMQAALYEAQKNYAKTGDKDLEGLLVDILVERASTTERNIHQIVLDEALSVAAKLTSEQMDALTLNFLISRTSNSTLNTLPAISEYIKAQILPFLKSLLKESSCYEHLVYVGCGSLLQVNSLRSIEEIFQQQYGGLFLKGFTREQLNQEIEDIEQYLYLIVNCLHDDSLLQINAINKELIDKTCNNENIPEQTKQKIINLYDSTLMSPSEIKDYLISVVPDISTLFDLWSTTGLSKFIPTTVGIAIAQANFRRKTDIKLSLSMWVK